MFTSADQIREVFNQFEGIKILVAGDVMIDSYLRGTVDRISPEAPVPVVALRQREDMLGGSANVALNLKSLGATPLLCSVIGDDSQGVEFLRLLDKEGINSSGIIKDPDRITTTKYRIIGNKMQMLRVDHETDQDLSFALEQLYLERIDIILRDEKPSVIIIQDYNKGVLTPKVISGIISRASEYNIPVAVDPKKRNFDLYHHVALFKPNLKEIKEGLRIQIDPASKSSLSAAASSLRNSLDAGLVMITLSEGGVFIYSDSEAAIIKGHTRSVADVSGAGDTVISVASLCLSLGLDPISLASLSNLAGGLVCEHIGVVPVNKADLLSEASALLVKT